MAFRAASDNRLGVLDTFAWVGVGEAATVVLEEAAVVPSDVSVALELAFLFELTAAVGVVLTGDLAK